MTWWIWHKLLPSSEWSCLPFFQDGVPSSILQSWYVVFLAAWFIHIPSQNVATAKKEASFSFLFICFVSRLPQKKNGLVVSCDQVTHKSSFVTLTFLSRFFFCLYGHIGRSTQRLLVSPLAFRKTFVDLDDLTLPEDWSGSLEARIGKPHGGWKKALVGKGTKRKWLEMIQLSRRQIHFICFDRCDMSIVSVYSSNEIIYTSYIHGGFWAIYDT